MPRKPVWTLRSHLPLAGLIICVVGGASCFAQTGSIKSMEDDADRWIELQSQIAKTKNEWRSEKILLENTIKLLEAEQATLKQTLESNQRANEVYVANRDRIKALVDENRSGVSTLAEPLLALENRLRILMPRLPQPLQQEVRSHLSRLNAEGGGAAVSVPTRAQGLIAALTAVDRFSNTLTTARETRPAPGGGEVSVQVLYWGLAGAYGVDLANRRAWVVAPGATGWEWNERNDLYEPIFKLIDSYDNESKDPELLMLPAEIQ